MENSKSTETFLKITYSSKEFSIQLEVGDKAPFLQDNHFSQARYNKFLEDTINSLSCSAVEPQV